MLLRGACFDSGVPWDALLHFEHPPEYAGPGGGSERWPDDNSLGAEKLVGNQCLSSFHTGSAEPVFDDGGRLWMVGVEGVPASPGHLQSLADPVLPLQKHLCVSVGHC